MTEEKQLKWNKVKALKLDLGNGHNVVASKEELLVDDEQNGQLFYIIKKWKTDEDGVSFKRPSKIYIQARFWPEIKQLVDKLSLPD